MKSRVVSVVSLLLVAGLAGCTREEDPAPVEPAPLAPGEVETPAGTLCEACAEAPPVQKGPFADRHSHDYWDGETRKVIGQWNASLTPIPLVPDGKAPGTAIADYDLAAPNLVYEGTHHLEILFDQVCVWGREVVKPVVDPYSLHCASHPFFSLRVDYLTAADKPGAFRHAGEVTQGMPLAIMVAPTEADMPHQTKSLWLFRVYTNETNALSYNVTITAHRKNASIAEWPPHPDPYAKEPERTVLEGDFVTNASGVVGLYLHGPDDTWAYPERVISEGTTDVEVTVKVLSLSVRDGKLPPLPASYQLEFKNASYLTKLGNGDAAGGRLVAETAGGETLTFRVPVDPNGLDTPYAANSRWGFRLVARFDGGSCEDPHPTIMQGCQAAPYVLKYHMKVVAKGRSISEPAPAGA